MWSILATLCIRAANADGTHDGPMMLQVNALADFGQTRLSKTPNFFVDSETLTSLDDWHSDRYLAFIPPPQNLRFTERVNISTVTAVAVYERLSDDSYASYIAVVTDHPGAQADLSQHRWNWTQRQWEYLENQSLESTPIRGKEEGYYYTVSEETNKSNPKKELRKHVSYVSQLSLLLHIKTWDKARCHGARQGTALPMAGAQDTRARDSGTSLHRGWQVFG